MMELWRYMYKYEGRWYEAYAYLLLGTTPEVAHQKIVGVMAPEVSELQARRGGHVTSVAGCGPSKRVPKSYAITTGIKL
jgi:hypothetical protein